MVQEISTQMNTISVYYINPPNKKIAITLNHIAYLYDLHLGLLNKYFNNAILIFFFSYNISPAQELWYDNSWDITILIDC